MGLSGLVTVGQRLSVHSLCFENDRTEKLNLKQIVGDLLIDVQTGEYNMLPVMNVTHCTERDIPV